MTVTIASFYTPGGEYPAHARRLRKECARLWLPYVIQQRQDMGGYLANCRQKPVFLRETLMKLDAPLLWLDVDSTILRKPAGLGGAVDVMARAKPRDETRAWHVDALYLNATPGALAWLDLWCGMLADDSDEAAFDRAWKSGEWAGTMLPLPASYRLGGPIVHYRRSRSREKRDAHRWLAGR